MNAIATWGLLAAAVVVGWMGWGWPGVALAVTVSVFWLLLQFSRALRVLRVAAGNPVGQVPSAVMLHSALRPGLRLPQVLVLTRSLGTRLSEQPEVWAWRDEGGNEVRLEMIEGRLARWDLHRAAA